MPDDVEFRMTYPCYFLCGDRGGLECITVNVVTCLCMFTDAAKLQAFQEDQLSRQKSEIAFPMEVAFAACRNYDELVDRLTTAESELAAAGIHHLPINPVPGEPAAYISIREFIEALPRE